MIALHLVLCALWWVCVLGAGFALDERRYDDEPQVPWPLLLVAGAWVVFLVEVWL